ncbi:PIN domain-containing protein [Siminovitchia sediminis]|uniref:PIN domain-containing protein n=1 Tax=Siminovitchia sediminis TaxID=1274353 RepID=A0ABW4KGP9_9BACI
MGITYLLRDYTEDLPVWLGYYTVIHAVVILYFWKVHHKIFKSRPIGTRSFILSLAGFGFGQAYNRQIIKAVIAAAIIPFLAVSYKNGLLPETDTMAFIIFGVIVLISIDAGASAYSGQKRAERQYRTNEIMKKAQKVKKYGQGDHQFGVDTNILMHEPDLLVYLMEKEHFHLNMSMMVFSELDGLKKNDDPLTRRKAQLAFDIIEEFQQRGQLKILKTPKTDDIRKYGLGGSPDEKIIGTYMKERENGIPNLVFLSNDKGARIIARNVGMPVADIS